MARISLALVKCPWFYDMLIYITWAQSHNLDQITLNKLLCLRKFIGNQKSKQIPQKRNLNNTFSMFLVCDKITHLCTLLFSWSYDQENNTHPTDLPGEVLESCYTGWAVSTDAKILLMINLPKIPMHWLRSKEWNLPWALLFNIGVVTLTRLKSNWKSHFPKFLPIFPWYFTTF